jgi:hypothetical protein
MAEGINKAPEGLRDFTQYGLIDGLGKKIEECGHLYGFSVGNALIDIKYPERARRRITVSEKQWPYATNLSQDYIVQGRKDGSIEVRPTFLHAESKNPKLSNCSASNVPRHLQRTRVFDKFQRKVEEIVGEQAYSGIHYVSASEQVTAG